MTAPEVDLCPTCGTDRLRAMCWCGVQSVEYPDALRVVADALQSSLGWDWPETPEERIPSGREICADVAADVLASILASGLVLIPASERARTESVDRVVNEFIARSTGSATSPDPVPGFTPPICSWCSNPIHGDAEGEASTGRVHHARDECPSPPQRPWFLRG